MYAFAPPNLSASSFSTKTNAKLQISSLRKVTRIASCRGPSFQCRRCVPAQMSGVNGGIDYEIDISAVPVELGELVRKIEQGADTATELIEAAQELSDASKEYTQLLPVLVDMLGYNNPVAARTAMDALANAGSAAVPSLLTGVAAFNYAVNAYALRTLARIGDPSVVSVASECASRAPIPNVRRAACRTLAALRYENLEDARNAYVQLILLADREPDWGVRYAAIVALETFCHVHLVSEELIGIAINVVRSASEGSFHAAPDALREFRSQSFSPLLPAQENPTKDGTVMARAKMALDIMQAPSVSVKGADLDFESISMGAIK